jgi:hypothetical protein
MNPLHSSVPPPLAHNPRLALLNHLLATIIPCSRTYALCRRAQLPGGSRQGHRGVGPGMPRNEEGRGASTIAPNPKSRSFDACCHTMSSMPSTTIFCLLLALYSAQQCSPEPPHLKRVCNRRCASSRSPRTKATASGASLHGAYPLEAVLTLRLRSSTSSKNKAFMMNTAVAPIHTIGSICGRRMLEVLGF